MSKSPELIDLIRLTELFNVASPDDFWFTDICEVDTSGIRPKPIDVNLIGEEWRVVARSRNDLKLELPCQPNHLIEWAIRNSCTDILPSDFLSEHANPKREIDDAQTSVVKHERELTRWMRETWVGEGKPGGTNFFQALKKYTDTKKYPNSPIREHYNTSPNGAGIRWCTSNATNNMGKKNIQSMASKFKKEDLKILSRTKSREFSV